MQVTGLKHDVHLEDVIDQLRDELLDDVVQVVALYHSSPLIISSCTIPAVLILV